MGNRAERVLRRFIGSGAFIALLALAAPAFGQEDPPGAAFGVDMQFTVTLGDTVTFTITAADSIDAAIHAFTSQSLEIALQGVTGVDSTQITITGLPTGAELYKSQDDLRNYIVITVDETGACTWVQDLTTPHSILFKPHPSTWYLDDTGWVAQWKNPMILKWGGFGTEGGQFDRPWGVALDASGDVYVADFGNNRIQKFDADGTFLAKWGSSGTGDGQFNGPVAVAVAATGDVYVGERFASRIQKFDANGNFLAKWGGTGTGDEQFSWIYGVAVDGNGLVYVTDYNNHRIQKFDADGTFLAKWGSKGTGDGQFNIPSGVAVAGNGDVYVADRYNYRVQKFDANGSFLAKWGSPGTGDGQFSLFHGVAVDGNGLVYVTDYGNHRIQKFNSAGAMLKTPGNWDVMTTTAVLTENVDETIQITGTNIILDGGGFRVDAPASGYGIYIAGGSNNTLRNVTVNSSSEEYAVYARCPGSVVQNSTISSTGSYALYLSSAPDAQIYNNNIYSAYQPIVDGNSLRTVFNLCRPTGGNYWSAYNGIDADGDGFGDTRFGFGGNWGQGQDNLPYMVPDGWTLPAAEPEEPSLVALYSFDGDPQDLSENGNNPIQVNGIAYAAGFEGQAAEFDGISSFIDIPVDIGPTHHPEITFGAWVYTHVSSGGRAILSSDNCCYDRQIGLDSRWGGPGWSAFSGVTDGGGVNSGIVAVNQWTFVAVRYDGCTTTLFVGDQVFQTGETTRDGTANARIGKNPNYNEHFDGLIDNLFIIDGALTDEQVAAIRANGIAGLTGPFSVSVSGTVSSDCVGPVADVAVDLMDAAGESHTAFTDQNGFYLFEDLPSSSAPASVVIDNFGFEAPSGLAEDAWALVQDWIGATVFNPGAGRYYTSSAPPGMHGTNSGFLWSGGPSDVLATQTLSETLAADMNYQLSIALGNRDGWFEQYWGGYRLRLIADYGGGGHVVLDSGEVTTNPAPAGVFSTILLSGTTGSSPAGLGAPLTIVIEILEHDARHYLDFDNVRLTSSSVSEAGPGVSINTPPGFLVLSPEGGYMPLAFESDAVVDFVLGCVFDVSGTVSSNCAGPLAGSELQLQVDGQDPLMTVSDDQGAYTFECLAFGTGFTVSAALPADHVFIAPEAGSHSIEGLEANANVVADFTLGCLFDVSGSVSSGCQGPMAGVEVTLDLPGDPDDPDDPGDYLTVLTVEDGSYLFEDLLYAPEWEPGFQPELTCVLPLGFHAVDPVDGHASLTLEVDTTADFALGCVEATGTARGMGYWKHQATVYVKGKGNAQESEADMATNFPAAIFGHFHENTLNGIAVEGVTFMGDPHVPLDLATIQTTLTVNGGQNMLARAKQHYLSLLLNLASGKLMTWTSVSEDGRTASEALQYIADLINDGDGSNDALAKDLSEAMNEAQMLGAGVIPEGYSTIYYAIVQDEASPARFALEGNHPNPFNPKTQIRFSLPAAGAYTLVFHDVTGRLVSRLEGQGQAGRNQVDWTARDDSGRPLASGVYYCTLKAAGQEATSKLTLLR